MRLPACMALAIMLTWGLAPAIDLAGAGGLTESLQSERMTVIEVNATAGQIVSINGKPDGRIVHRVASGAPVITEVGQTSGPRSSSLPAEPLSRDATGPG